MKCVTCGYELWNLPEPRCPECGEEFRVTDWDFEPGAVEFRCGQCRAALPHQRHREPPHRCPTCDRVIDWTAVGVVPTTDERARIARRRSAWTGVPPLFSAIVVLIPFVCAGSVTAPLATRHVSFQTYAFFTIAMFCAALFGIALAGQKQRRKAVVIWTTVAALYIGGTIWMAVLQSLDEEWRRWYIWRSSALREIGVSAATYMMEHEKPPPHPLALIGDYTNPGTFVISGRGVDPATNPVGRQTLQDWIDGRGSDTEREIQIQRDLDGGSEWIRLGDFYISTAATAWSACEETPRPQCEIIVAITAPHPRTGKQIALHAHGGVWAIDRQEQAAQNEMRKSFGLEPLPDFSK